MFALVYCVLFYIFYPSPILLMKIYYRVPTGLYGGICPSLTFCKHTEASFLFHQLVPRLADSYGISAVSADIMYTKIFSHGSFKLSLH